MIDAWIALLQKPALWQRSDEPFWDDDHISKGMLDAHLHPDWDSASRSHGRIDRCVQWLSTVIPAGGKILDLGCGPGLYAKRLSDLGYDVTGMDLSRRSIAYAKAHDPKTTYILQNYVELDVAGAFDLIMIINGDYAALTLGERQTMLSKIYRALKPGGLFIFDVFTEKTTKGKADTTWWSVCEDGCFMHPDPHICLKATYSYENNTVALDQHIVVADDGVHAHLIWNTVYTRQTLTQEVLPFGFGVKGVYDDECGRPYTGESDLLCFVLERGVE